MSQLYFVVGDYGLDSGNGIRVPTLETMRDRLRQHTQAAFRRPWTLVISIHGNENILGTTGGAVVNPERQGVTIYRAPDIGRIFNVRQFTAWRNAYGPNRVVLNACQVTAEFEGVILLALLRPGSTQSAQGLGGACRPDTELQTIEYNGRRIRTMQQWNRLPAAQRRSFLQSLQQLNRQYGYFGAPSVPNNRVLRYFFYEEPFSTWPVVRVSHNRRRTNVPFYNRTQHRLFMRQCSRNIGTLPGHRPTVPPAVQRRP